MTERIHRRRTKGWHAPENTRYVGRGSNWGNPWVVVQTPRGWAANWIPGGIGPKPPAADQWRDAPTRHAAHAIAVDFYRSLVTSIPGFTAAARTHLAGRNLMCWCPPELPCHADVILELANQADRC